MNKEQLEIVKNIRGKYDTPIIGIVGATTPTTPYTSKMGFEVGYELRKLIESTKGTLFNGGVDGVGSDAYHGIVIYSWLNKTDDKFFCAFPDIPLDGSISKSREMFIPALKYDNSKIDNNTPANAEKKQRFDPPQQYFEFAQLTKNEKLNIEYTGKDMTERREYLGAIADIIIVVNGSLGTEHEVFQATEYNTPIICLSNSGGAAELFSRIARDPNIKYFSDLDPHFPHINKNTLHPVDSIDELIYTTRNMITDIAKTNKK